MRMSTITASGGSRSTAVEQRLGVADLGDDLDALVREQTRERRGESRPRRRRGSRARELGVQHRAGGHWADDLEVPVERLDAVAQPAQPAAAGRRRRRRRRRRRPRGWTQPSARVTEIVALDACACLATLASASDATK